MDIKEFALMQKLIFCVNRFTLDRSFHELAYYLLLHYNEMEHIPLKQLMADCFASASTVRRFCQSIGYENYSALRQAKSRNREDQRQIVRCNRAKGRYQPRALHDGLSAMTYQIGRGLQTEQLQELARRFVQADCSILFAIRPYALFLEEFQCQMISLGKAVYIVEEVPPEGPPLRRPGSRINSVVVSPTGGILCALGEEVATLPGPKCALICQDYARTGDCAALLSLYDLVLPLNVQTHDIEYMELYGKYGVAYLFEILLGEIAHQLQGADEVPPAGR